MKYRTVTLPICTTLQKLKSGQPVHADELVQYDARLHWSDKWFSAVQYAAHPNKLGTVVTLEEADAPAPVAPVPEPTIADVLQELRSVRHELVELRTRIDNQRVAWGAKMEVRP